MRCLEDILDASESTNREKSNARALWSLVAVQCRFVALRVGVSVGGIAFLRMWCLRRWCS